MSSNYNSTWKRQYNCSARTFSIYVKKNISDKLCTPENYSQAFIRNHVVNFVKVTCSNVLNPSVFRPVETSWDQKLITCQKYWTKKTKTTILLNNSGNLIGFKNGNNYEWFRKAGTYLFVSYTFRIFPVYAFSTPTLKQFYIYLCMCVSV